MQKTLISTVIGSALLVLGGTALAQTQEPAASASPVVSERVISDVVVEEVVPDAQANTAATAADGDNEGKAIAAPQRSVRTVQKDAGSTIEELRVGGQTQEITVQPAGNAPAYQVRPNNNNSYRQDSGRHSSDGTNGPRVWNVLEF